MKTTVAVVVARFQVATLHAGHRDLLDFAAAAADKVLVVLGTSKSLATDRNPLSFELRAKMLRELYPNFQVVELLDHPSDTVWSARLDAMVASLYPEATIKLYGSRNSFADYYSGSYEVVLFEPKNDCNGTAERQALLNDPAHGTEFRAGIIYGVANRPPVCYPTVDVAVLRNDEHQPNCVLLAGKTQDQGKLRFVGGFVDVSDSSLELAARREVCEETSGMETGEYSFLGSAKVDDWRYRGTRDGIITSFFKASYVFGATTPSDDIDTLQWVPLSEMMERLVPEHKPLGEMLLGSL